MSFIAVTPAGGTLIHAFPVVEDRAPDEMGGFLIGRSACNLRKSIGFERVGGTDQPFESEPDRLHCLRCVRAVALEKASTDAEREQIERDFRAGKLGLAS